MNIRGEPKRNSETEIKAGMWGGRGGTHLARGREAERMTVAQRDDWHKENYNNNNTRLFLWYVESRKSVSICLCSHLKNLPGIS